MLTLQWNVEWLLPNTNYNEDIKIIAIAKISEFNLYLELPARYVALEALPVLHQMNSPAPQNYSYRQLPLFYHPILIRGLKNVKKTI